jgi:hypothetical protein
MKPILLVVACILLLIWVIYQHRDRPNNTHTQAKSPNSKDIKAAYEFLPEARLLSLYTNNQNQTIMANIGRKILSAFVEVADEEHSTVIKPKEEKQTSTTVDTGPVHQNGMRLILKRPKNSGSISTGFLKMQIFRS